MIEPATLKFLFIGSFFGLVAGISPGPLLALVISETLRYDRTAGIKIAVSPLVTDLPIILLTLFIFSKLSQADRVLAIISLAGGLYLLYLGFKTISVTDFKIGGKGNAGNSLVKGILVNFLSPHPYLFWITVGGPYIMKALDINIPAVIYFVVGFYFFLVGSKIMIAFLASHSKSFLKQNYMIWVLRILGAALFVFAIILIREGIPVFFGRS